MDKTTRLLNELLVGMFNDILTIEGRTLNNGEFKDLSITEIHTIEAIGLYQPRTMSEVAAFLKITVGTLTVTVNKLVNKGYVERNRIEEDRRIVQIQLTQKGLDVYKAHQKFHDHMITEMKNLLDEEEEKVIIKSLEKLNDFFKSKYASL